MRRGASWIPQLLIKCNIEGREYKVFGYKGKQVRDNIHSEDVARFMLEFYKAPRVAEVYNLGGGKENSCSILEAFSTVEQITGRPMNWRYVDANRIGDHICYYSDLRKMESHYPGWHVTKSYPTFSRRSLPVRWSGEPTTPDEAASYRAPLPEVKSAGAPCA